MRDEALHGRRGSDAALRPVDLARAAGISTQQVRNYEAAGVLPPAPRTESGYRRYARSHLAALLTYRALAPGFGADTAAAIMRAVHADDEAGALRLVDAAHAGLHERRLATDSAGAAAAAAAGTADGIVDSRRALRIGELAARLGVRASALRVWEAAGLLTPARDAGGHRGYEAEHVRQARVIAMLRQGRYGFEQIRPVLEGLRGTGSTDALLAALADRRATHDRQSRAMLHGGALLGEYLAGGAGAAHRPRGRS